MRYLAILIMLLGYIPVGAQWTIKNLDENSRRNTTVKFKNDSVGLAMGGYTYFLKTVNAGETWTKIPYQVTVDIKDFQFLGDSSVLAVGRYSTGNSENFNSRLIKSDNSPEKGFIGTEYGTTFKTTDGGNTRSEVQVSTNLPVHSIQFISEMEGFATGGSEAMCVTGSGCFSEIDLKKQNEIPSSLSRQAHFVPDFVSQEVRNLLLKPNSLFPNL